MKVIIGVDPHKVSAMRARRPLDDPLGIAHAPEVPIGASQRALG